MMWQLTADYAGAQNDVVLKHLKIKKNDVVFAIKQAKEKKMKAENP